MAGTGTKGLMNLQARGMSMRNDTAMSGNSQHPQNKDPEGVTPGPQYQPAPIRIKLPKNLESEKNRAGAKVMHLAEGHHVKNDDGSTSFHMHALDGEPVDSGDVESEQDDGRGDSSLEGSPYGISEALKGLNQ